MGLLKVGTLSASTAEEDQLKLHDYIETIFKIYSYPASITSVVWFLSFVIGRFL
jgi:hypothetical protein